MAVMREAGIDEDEVAEESASRHVSMRARSSTRASARVKSHDVKLRALRDTGNGNDSGAGN